MGGETCHAPNAGLTVLDDLGAKTLSRLGRATYGVAVSCTYVLRHPYTWKEKPV